MLMTIFSNVGTCITLAISSSLWSLALTSSWYRVLRRGIVPRVVMVSVI